MDKEYPINGALQLLDGKTAALMNFRQGTALDKRSDLTNVEPTAKITIGAGVIPGSSTVPNFISAISATQEAQSVSMAVNPMATPIQTSAAPAAASVGVASGAVLSANPARRHVVLVNTSGVNISLAFGQAAVLNSGITLMANGGSYEMSAQQGNLNLQEIRAIAAAAASNLSIQEDT